MSAIFGIVMEGVRVAAGQPAKGIRKILGDLGERLAVQHLLAKGYEILERNFRTREGEIDIVAQRGGVLAFVEVRSRRGTSMGGALESLSDAKQQRMVRLAEAYAQARTDLPAQHRIDVIAVDFSAERRLKSLRHLENCVWAV